MQDIRGRVVVVTGAASGLGRALAGRFGAEGCRVVLADIEQEPLDRAAAELAAVDGRNRPSTLTSRPPGPLHPLFADMNENARRLIDDSGMAPEEVAALTVDAVRNGLFYVLPHREQFRDALRQRFDSILSGTPPPPPTVTALPDPSAKDDPINL